MQIFHDQKESFRLVRVESPWISAGEDEVFLTVIPLEDELTGLHQ